MERERELVEESKRIRREKQQLKLKQVYEKLQDFETRKEIDRQERAMNRQIAYENKTRELAQNF